MPDTNRYLKRIQKGKGRKMKKNEKEIGRIFEELIPSMDNEMLRKELNEQRKENKANQIKFQAGSKRSIKEKNVKMRQGTR